MAERQLEIVESEGFTVVYNDLIQDSRLRLQTRAVLVLMLSKPKNWDFSVRGMAAIAGVTKDTMARMLNELIEAGYVQRKEQSREGGKFGKGGFMVSGRPQFAVPEPGEGETPPGGALYFLSRATKSTKKCPSRDLCRADDAERLEPRGVPAADSFPCRGNVPGASISLREDDAGPCGSRRRREYGQADVGSAAPQGPAEGGTAAGAAARAGEFISPSEYEMEGVPDANQRSVCGGEKVPAKLERSELSGVDAGPCGECGVEKEAAPMSMVREAQSPAAASRPCPDFSYTNPSYAKNSPQQNKEQENTKQEQHTPPKSPLWAERKARERHFDPALESAVLSWLRYKSERGEMYKPTGLQTLLTRIENKASAFGAAAVVDIIEQSMSANWQGIVWDKLKKSAPAAPVRRFWE